MNAITAEDVKKGLSDQEWRLNHLYYVKNEEGEKTLFRMKPAQKELYDDIWYLNIILKARQLGFSTLIDLMGFDLAFWSADKEVIIQAHDRDSAEKLFEEKVQYVYDNLHDDIKAINPKVRSNTRQLKFKNGSVIRVVVSARSGTSNFLHISEFGKICAKYPDKARETVSGSLNTVAPGQFVFIESTAEGREGAFYDMTQEAMRLQREMKKLTKMDYRFHFFPWYRDKKYRLPVQNVVFTKSKLDYFKDLEAQLGFSLDDEQKAWYIKKEAEQKEDMKREFPSTPQEAFEQSIIGSYFQHEMTIVRTKGQITRVQYEPRLPVYTFWDIGRDTMSIWFMQYNRIGKEFRFIDYMQDMNRNLQYYAKELQKLPYFYGTAYLPHDAAVKDLTSQNDASRADVLRGFGFDVYVVPRVNEKANSIRTARDILPLCWFDEEKCAEGIKCLDHYRAEWDDKLGTFKRDKPLHDWASHGSDSFQQFAIGFDEARNVQTPESDLIPEYVEDY